MSLICCNNTVNGSESCIILIDSTLDFCAILWHNERMQKEARRLPDNSLSQTDGLRVYLLGPLRIERDGVAIHLPRRKVEALLAYLLLHPEPQTRDFLATLFWGDSSDAQARHSLRTALATVRKEVAADLLLADRDQVQRNPDFACWVDLQALLTVEQELDTIAVDLLLAQLALWQGDLLTGFYEDWIVLEREHYRERLLKLCLQATQTLRARSEYAQAIAVAQRVLTLDLANEHAHQHLMFCYMAAGDRPAALRQYELCERALAAELDVPPQRETTALYHWIRQQSSEAAATAARITNLPIPLTSFVGRTEATAAVKRLLSSPAGKTRLLTLTGAGGSGKTRLAIQTATDLIDRFANGVWWVELAALTEGEQVAQAVAKALGVTERPQEPAVQSVVNFLGEKELLLVIDNCEHLVAASAQLAVELLSRCPHLQILTTSREALNVAGEMIWQVPTLGLPTPQEVLLTDLLGQFECIRLFVERASAVQPGFHLTLENAPAVVNICTQLDGIPLAIELAAARVKVLPVAQIAARLTSAIGARFALLTQGSRTALPRQQTLRAAIDWSYDLLAEAERHLFHTVAVFRGGFTLDALEQILDFRFLIFDSPSDPAHTVIQNPLDLLTQLVDKSLVIVELQDGENRYRLLETLRDYAQAKMAGSVEADQIHRRHAEVFFALAQRAEPELLRAQQQLWLTRLETEHANLRAALAYLLTDGDRALALRLATALHRLWDYRGYVSEGREWLRKTLADRGDAPLETQTKALNAAGWLAYRQSDLAQAQRCHEEALLLAEQAEDEVGIVDTLQHLAVIEMDQGDYGMAQERIEKSLTLARALAYQQGIARALTRLGSLAWDQDRITEALAYRQESLRIEQALGNQVNMASAFLGIGDAERFLGHVEAAQSTYEESLKLSKALGHKGLMGAALKGLGMLAFKQEAYTQARHFGEEALRIFREVGDQAHIGFALTNLGDVARKSGDERQALAYYGQALAIMHAIGYKWPTFYALEDIAQLLTDVGQHAEAATRFLGAAAALRAETAIPVTPEQQAAYNQHLTTLRQRLGALPFDTLWHTGQTTPLAHIVIAATELVLR